MRLRVISEAYGAWLTKRSQFIADINDARSVIAETSLLGLPFFYEPFRITREEVFGPSGLKKMLDKDNYQLSLLDGKEAPVILDIGSHIGIFPRVIKQKFPLAKIYSIEPDRDNFRVLRLNNEIIDSAKSFQYGVYESETKIRLVASDHNSWRSSLKINPDFFCREIIGDDSYAYDSYEIECVSVDHLVESQGIAHVDLIGVTVPGQIAMPILKGTLKTINLFRPVVSISLYPSEVETVQILMQSLGYRLSAAPVGNMHAFVGV
jgi:FkbM family methyltransferase